MRHGIAGSSFFTVIPIQQLLDRQGMSQGTAELHLSQVTGTMIEGQEMNAPVRNPRTFFGNRSIPGF